ncbi:MAG: hypothetical protein AAAC48_22905, partial [Phyllobacterium sp.]|uniref:hypothetical protein n=1 Tax=Phyllobacterium sp. TaxID=1871046 RepID=UPI0030F2D8AE
LKSPLTSTAQQEPRSLMWATNVKLPFRRKVQQPQAIAGSFETILNYAAEGAEDDFGRRTIAVAEQVGAATRSIPEQPAVSVSQRCNQIRAHTTPIILSGALPNREKHP